MNGIQTVKRQDSHLNPRSLEEEPGAAYTTPSSATALFSRNGVAHERLAASSDAVQLLLQESGATQDGAASAAEPEESYSASAEEKIRNPHPVDRTAPAAVPATPRVDLTGIFRKVRLERVADDGSKSVASFSETGEMRPAERGSQASSTMDATTGQGSGDPAPGFTQLFRALSEASAGASSAVPASLRDRAPYREGGSAEEKFIPMKRSEEALPGTDVPQQIDQHGDAQGDTQGRFTLPFQSLDREQSVAAHADSDSSVPAAVPRVGGGFTQLLRTLSAETEAETPAAPAAPLPPQPSNGPGEFTRIISGSMLREAQGRTARFEAAKARADKSPSSAELEGATPPNAVQSIAPIMSAPPAAAHLAPEQPISPAPPPMPAVATMLPSPPAAPRLEHSAPGTGKLQQYIPLLLIANFFLMFLVLILVVFLLLHRG
jgi:hypothetical protein